jgi:membrane-bound ClpP family serine protease
MENATKALLIAAAVLVAILIISLGLVVYNMAAESVNNNSSLSAQEIQAFNDQFTQYEGDNVRGTRVNSLLKTALNNNITQQQEGNEGKIVSITAKSCTVAINLSEKTMTKADSSKMYKVVVKLDGPGGLVKTIEITQNS